MQEQQLVNDFRVHALGNTQRLFGQRQGQGFGAGPNEKTNSMGGHSVLSGTKTRVRNHMRQTLSLGQPRRMRSMTYFGAQRQS